MIGIDGCKKGFMFARLNGLELTFSYESDLSSLIDEKELILIDVPLGCPSSMHELRPEPMMRSFLKKRSSSVFNVPALQTLNATSYQEANIINKSVLNKGISQQSYHIIPIINKVNDFMLAHPHLNLHESHPELIFTWMKGRICDHSKHTKEGIIERVDILTSQLSIVEKPLNEALKQFPTKVHQDIVDSCACVVCAYLTVQKGIMFLPPDFHTNIQGLEMKIVLFDNS